MRSSEALKDRVRHTLIGFGYRGGAGLQRRLQTIFNYSDLGRWAKETFGILPPHVPSRFELFQIALSRVSGSAPLYLEFGVYEGGTLRWWVEHLKAEDAHFVGFDSFEGLPEQWNPYNPPGTFAVAEIPHFDDERVSLQAGWFDDTLPKLEFPKYDQLIVNIDSDLYSSANFVLRELEERLVPGTLIYFDELGDRDHELRALREFMIRTDLKLEPLGMSRGGVHWLFEVK